MWFSEQDNVAEEESREIELGHLLYVFCKLTSLILETHFLHSFILSQHWISVFIKLLLSLQSRVDMYVGHSPAGTSVQDMFHWRQVELCTDT